MSAGLAGRKRVSVVAADGRNFKLYEYTDNDGNTHNLRVEVSTGDDADFGFGAYDAANPLWIRTPRNQPRQIVMMHAATGRTVTRPVGTTACDAWATSPFTEDLPFPGKADLVTYQRVRKIGERKVNTDQTLRNLGEPAADA